MKTIIVTGASRGIGLATAKKFLEQDWRVIGTYKESSVPINSVELTSLKLDLSSLESITNFTNEVKHTATQIDALVNNAGIILDAHDLTADLDKIRKTFEVNLFGTIDLTEKLLPLMNSKGHIVNTGSLYGAFSFPIDDSTSTGYRLAKASLNMYTRILAFRLKERGIIVSSLDPGWVKTDMGYSVATATEKPDREPFQTADDIYDLITNIGESGYFWRFGEKREW